MLFYVHGFKKTVYLIYALLSRIKFCRDYALFKGHFWPKFDGRGHGNILKDRDGAIPGMHLLFKVLVPLCQGEERNQQDIVKMKRGSGKDYLRLRG